jgi:hypothetical protein
MSNQAAGWLGKLTMVACKPALSLKAATASDWVDPGLQVHFCRSLERCCCWRP